MSSSKHSYKVIDLFAGPGGLAEGFASITNAAGDVITVVKAGVPQANP